MWMRPSTEMHKNMTFIIINLIQYNIKSLWKLKYFYKQPTILTHNEIPCELTQWNTMWTKQNMHYYDTRPQPTKLVQTITISKNCVMWYTQTYEIKTGLTHEKVWTILLIQQQKLTIKYIIWTAAAAGTTTTTTTSSIGATTLGGFWPATATTTTTKCPSCYSFHMCCNK